MATTAKKKPDTRIVPAETHLPALASMYEEDAGGGFEQADRESYAIPFMIILQSNSPQVKKSEGAYIKGAAEGMIMNTVTQELFPASDVEDEPGITVVPCYYRRTILEWGDRQTGGKGFYGQHDPLSPEYVNAERNEKGKAVTPEGNILSDTREHYVIVVMPDGMHVPAIVSLSSTQIKASKNWMSKMDGLKMKRADGSLYTPPMFSHTYRMTSVPQKNDQGAWMGWKIELVGPVEDPDLYAKAKQFREAVKRGEAKVKHEDELDIGGNDTEEF